MQLNRNNLIAVLKAVSPGLASKDIIQVFTCFCFDGKNVITYDDSIAVAMPFEAGIVGGVKGDLLLGWLNSVSEDSIDASVDGLVLKLKAGAVDLKTPLTPEKDFIFKFPDDSAAIPLPLTPEIIDPIIKCSSTMGTDPSRPQMLGITVKFEKDGLSFFSTIDSAISHYSVKLGELPAELVGRSAILPPPFCQLVTKYAASEKKDKDQGELWLANEWVEARYPSGLRLYARTPPGAKPEMYEKILNSMVNDQVKKLMLPVPPQLKQSLDRAMLIVDGVRDKRVNLTITDKKIVVEASSTIGNVYDIFDFGDHISCKANTNPAILQAGLELAKSMYVIEKRCIILTDGNYTQVVCVYVD